MATAAITGTVTESVNEAAIVTGAKTLIITLTGDTWIAAGGSPTGGDNLLGETFEAPGYVDADWVETFAGSSTVTDDASHSGTLWRTDKGSYALSTYYDATNVVYSTNTLAAGQTKTYTQFYWYFDRNAVTGNNDYSRIARMLEADAAGLVWDVIVNHTTGDGLDKMQIRYYNQTPTLTTYSTGVTVTPGNWYGFRVYYYATQASAGIDFWIDSGAGFVQYTPTDTSTRNMTARKLLLGHSSPVGTKQTATFQYDVVKIDSAAFETGY